MPSMVFLPLTRPSSLAGWGGAAHRNGVGQEHVSGSVLPAFPKHGLPRPPSPGVRRPRERVALSALLTPPTLMISDRLLLLISSLPPFPPSLDVMALPHPLSARPWNRGTLYHPRSLDDWYRLPPNQPRGCAGAEARRSRAKDNRRDRGGEKRRKGKKSKEGEFV